MVPQSNMVTGYKGWLLTNRSHLCPRGRWTMGVVNLPKQYLTSLGHGQYSIMNCIPPCKVVGVLLYIKQINKFNYLFVLLALVSCPASLFKWNMYLIWFHVPRSWCGQSDCRTVVTSQALFEKDCDANLKGLREGQFVRYSASNRWATHPFGVG